ncbi:MAG TPA: FHA domain-containing protein [Candidatus Saccharimonadales bacterium]|nr:FHA domain-containing protein [Candidatus Saccharimonadales bacterium]
MEITFAVVLWAVRLAFLALLYLFLIRAFRSLQRALATEKVAAEVAQTGLAYLVVQRSHAGGPKAGSRLPLRAVTTIGRDAGNDIVLNDEAASAKHAVLTFRDGEWWAEDAGSTNGTLLNASRIWEAERLRFGDEIDIGRIGLRLEQAAPA